MFFSGRKMQLSRSIQHYDPANDFSLHAFGFPTRFRRKSIFRQFSTGCPDIVGQFNITTRQTMANSSKNPNADDRGPSDRSFVSHGTKWKKKSMDGAAGAEVQRARAAWRPYANFPRAFSRHHCVPRKNKTIFGILATRASLHRVASLELIAQTQLKPKSLRSNRRAQANMQQFDRKNETGKNKFKDSPLFIGEF